MNSAIKATDILFLVPGIGLMHHLNELRQLKNEHAEIKKIFPHIEDFDIQITDLTTHNKILKTFNEFKSLPQINRTKISNFYTRRNFVVNFAQNAAFVRSFLSIFAQSLHPIFFLTTWIDFADIIFSRPLERENGDRGYVERKMKSLEIRV